MARLSRSPRLLPVVHKGSSSRSPTRPRCRGLRARPPWAQHGDWPQCWWVMIRLAFIVIAVASLQWRWGRFDQRPMPEPTAPQQAQQQRKHNLRHEPAADLKKARDAQLDEAEAAAAGQSGNSSRSFAQAGSLYQNSQDSLWNRAGGPISTLLRISADDRFELRVEHLDSVGDTNRGWIAAEAAFELEPVEGHPERRRVVLKRGTDGSLVVRYDERLYDQATLFLFSVLRRAGAAVFNAVRLEVDTRRDVFVVTPQSRMVRLVWNKPVELSKTTLETMWTVDTEEEPDKEPRST